MFYCSIHIDMNQDIPPKVLERSASNAALTRGSTDNRLEKTYVDISR